MTTAAGRSPLAARSRATPARRLLRFDRVTRAAHWLTAASFFLCVVTALPLYFSSIERAVGRHVLVEQVHVWAGVAMPVPLLVGILGPWGATLRRDLRRLNRWSEAELRWFRGGAARLRPLQDKFNPGQKLNAAFVAGAIVLMLATGVVMQWFGLFPLGWRPGATFVHEVVAAPFAVVIAGHIAMAVSHRDALASMVRGWVDAGWARRHASAWAEEELGPLDPVDEGQHRRPG